MFGEEVSESPRQPSPWEALTSTTPELRPMFRRSSSSLSRSHRSDSSFELFTLDSRSVSLSPEVDSVGHIEYKLKLPPATPERLQKLVTQLKWRLLEGGGQCFYEIGVRDDGAILGLLAEELDESLETLEKMAESLGARCVVVREITLVTEDDEAGEDDDGIGPAPDNPLLARARPRCIAEPTLDPTPEISDSEHESITSALGELARLRLADTDDEVEGSLDASLSASTAAVLDQLPAPIIDPLNEPRILITGAAASSSSQDMSTPPVAAVVWTAEQIARRRKKQARRYASRVRRAAGIFPPTPPLPAVVTHRSRLASRKKQRPPPVQNQPGQRFAAEVLVALPSQDEGGPAYLAFEDAFTIDNDPVYMSNEA